MKPSPRLLAILIFGLGVASPVLASDAPFVAPDSLVLKNGTTVRGLIVKNSRDAVVLQQENGEVSYPKSEIVRIRDEANAPSVNTDVERQGDLPPWRAIANDLRTHDAIKSLVEIPATTVDTGEFKNVPYLSFRANRDIELNIFGDPEDPAGFEIGIYGSRASSDKLRKTIRAFLAGYLNSRAEIAALYALSFAGGEETVGDVVLEITPKSAPDAYGAWWISLSNRTALATVRLCDAEYAQLTRPEDEVVDRRGRVIANGWTDQQMNLSKKKSQGADEARVQLRGFYRDDNGDFRLITSPTAAN